VIKDILTDYNQAAKCANFNSERIYFNLKGTDYAIWFRAMTRSIKGKGQESYLRVQTFYPVELPEELGKLRSMIVIKANQHLSIYN
jgi:hypothetical protein